MEMPLAADREPSAAKPFIAILPARMYEMTNDENRESGNLDVITLSYATRLIFSEMDRLLVIERSLESIADMTGCQNLAMFLLSEADDVLELAGWSGPQGFASPDLAVPLKQSPLAPLLQSKQPGIFGLQHIRGIPFPAPDSAGAEKRCLCVPMVAADNVVTGFILMESAAKEQGQDLISMPLRILLTVATVALETARLFHLSVYDDLTGLYARRYFDHRLQEEEARVKRYGGTLSLVMADLDFFKRVNDTYGHQQGDRVLVETAALLQNAVRQELDMVCRYGGEEFVVILPHTGRDGALVAAERIRSAVEKHAFGGQEKPLDITLSLGVSFMDQINIVNREELLRRADSALYQAKRQGRNRVCLWDENHDMKQGS